MLALALLMLPAARVDAQSAGQGKIEGLIFNGTKDAKTPNLSGLPVTLYVADMIAQTTITRTASTDTNGRFSFANLDAISTTRVLAVASYGGVDYASDVYAFSGGQTTLSISLTVYETTDDPSAISVPQTHMIIDVQTRAMSIVEIVQVVNTGDRTFTGAPSAGDPHRVTLPLPILAGATDIQFQDPQADAATLRGANVLSYTLPLQPGNDQIVFNYAVLYNPPTYEFSLKLPYDTSKLRVLLSDVGATISSAQLSAPSSFPTQSGQRFLLSSADNLAKGTEVKATLTNLPEVVSGTAPTGGAPTTAPADNAQLVGFVVLGIAAIAAISLLAYPLLRRRAGRAQSSRRELLLQSIADLDDDFEAGKVSESTYKEERARLISKVKTLGDEE